MTLHFLSTVPRTRRPQPPPCGGTLLKHTPRQTGAGCNPPVPWYCKILTCVAAALALVASSQAALASTTPHLWAVTGCPALDPYTAGAPTTAALVMTVANASSFVLRGGPGCVIEGAVTLVFRIEAMRTFAVAAGLPNVTVAVQDVAMRTLRGGSGGAVPAILVHVATGSSLAVTDALPLDLTLERLSLSVDLCARTESYVPLIVVENGDKFPPRSKVLIRDVHISTSPLCELAANRAMSLEIYGVELGTLILRSGMNVTISNISTVWDHLPDIDWLSLSVIFGSVKSDTTATDTTTAAAAAMRISDVLLAVLSPRCAELYLNLVLWFGLDIRNAHTVTIQNPRIVVRNLWRMISFSNAFITINSMNLRHTSQFSLHGGDILIENNTLVGTYTSTIKVQYLIVFATVQLLDSAVLAVDMGRIVVANCTTQASRGHSSIVVNALTMSIEASQNASISITGAGPLFEQPIMLPAAATGRPALSFPSAAEIGSGVHVLGVGVSVGDFDAVVSVAALVGGMTLRHEATMRVAGLAVRVDGAFLNNTIHLRYRAVTVSVLNTVSLSLTSNTSRLSFLQSRVEVARVTAATITTGVITCDGSVSLSGSAMISDMTLVVMNSTMLAPSTTAVRANVISARLGTTVQGPGAVLAINKTCHRIEKMLLPANATVATDIFGPVLATRAQLTLSAGGQYMEGGNHTRCYPRAIRSASFPATMSPSKTVLRTATIAPTRTTVAPNSLSVFSTRTVSQSASLGAPPSASGDRTASSNNKSPSHSGASTGTAPHTATAELAPEKATPTETNAEATTERGDELQTTEPPFTTPPPPASTAPTDATTCCSSEPARPNVTEPQTITSPAPTNPAAQRGGVAEAGNANTIADRPGALAAVIVCSLIGLGVVIAAVAVRRWGQRRQHPLQALKDDDGKHSRNVMEAPGATEEIDGESCTVAMEGTD